MLQSIQMKKNYLWISLTAVLLLSFIFSYWPVFLKLLLRWDTGDNNYCYLIFPLFLYLCWEKKDSFDFTCFSWNLWGVLMALAASFLIILGQLGSVETLMYAGLWGGIAGVLISLYGQRLRYLKTPLVVLLFIIPLPPFINRTLTFNLKMIASTLSVKMLRLAGVSVLQDGNIIDLGMDQLQVVDACSGLRFFVPMILLAILVGYFFVQGQGWWRRWILLLLVLPLSIVINGLRIFATGMLTINGHKELAQNFFHDFFGWLTFMIAGAVLIAFAFILKKAGPSSEAKTHTDGGPFDSFQSPAKGAEFNCLKPVLITAAFSLIFMASGFAINQSPSKHNSPDRKEFKTFPMEIGPWKGSRNYLSKEIMQELWADDYISAVYQNKKAQGQIYLFIPFYEYQETRHTVHAPQACLLGGGWSIMDSRKRSVSVLPAKAIEVRSMVMEKNRTRMIANYFFLQRGRVITSPWMNKFFIMWDALTRNRTDGALVRIEMVLPPDQSIEKSYQEVDTFMSRIWPLLKEYVPD